MNEGLKGLEQHEGEKFMTIFIFGWTIPLNVESALCIDFSRCAFIDLAFLNYNKTGKQII